MKPKRWSEVPASTLDGAVQSGCTVQVPREEWLPFMSEAQKFTAAVGFRYDGPTIVLSAQTSTPVAMRMDVERHDPNDELHLNYVTHFFVRAPDGRVFMSPPVKDVDYGHHRATRPKDFEVT
jgi:hypothetical protein